MVSVGVPGVRRRGAAAATLAVLGLAACTSAAAPEPDPTPAVSPTTPTASPTPTRRRSGARVRIAVAGDVHFEGVLAERLRDPATALAPAAAALGAADVAIVNLETSVGSGGRPDPGKRFTFSAGPVALTALAAAGVDVAVMANNHALDFGRARLAQHVARCPTAAAARPGARRRRDRRDARTRPSARRCREVRGTVVATLAASVGRPGPHRGPHR